MIFCSRRMTISMALYISSELVGPPKLSLRTGLADDSSSGASGPKVIAVNGEKSNFRGNCKCECEGVGYEQLLPPGTAPSSCTLENRLCLGVERRRRRCVGFMDERTPVELEASATNFFCFHLELETCMEVARRNGLACKKLPTYVVYSGYACAYSHTSNWK